MSIQLSRRDFMKCSAVAVLAAASGTLLTGCSGGGSGVIIPPRPGIYYSFWSVCKDAHIWQTYNQNSFY